MRGFAAAWAEGQGATMDQLMAWAIELQELARSGRRATPAVAQAPAPIPAASRFPASQSILSPRELEVLRLMADGLWFDRAAGLLETTPEDADSFRATALDLLGGGS